MTIAEFRTHPEYETCMKKIRNYKPGFKFTIPFHLMTRQQENGMRVVLQDATREGLIESIQLGYGWDGHGLFRQTEETFIRTEVL